MNWRERKDLPVIIAVATAVVLLVILMLLIGSLSP